MKFGKLEKVAGGRYADCQSHVGESKAWPLQDCRWRALIRGMANDLR